MANINYNKTILGGRIASDIKLNVTANGIPCTSFSIAVSRRSGERGANNEQMTDFFNCVAWRNTAEFITKYFSKGSSILVTGSLQTRTWTDSQGQKKVSYDIIANEVCFVDSKEDNPKIQIQQQQFEDNRINADATDDDLPF